MKKKLTLCLFIIILAGSQIIPLISIGKVTDSGPGVPPILYLLLEENRGCDPGTPCYTYAPETRNVGSCFDGRFLLNANTNLCTCIEEVGPSNEVCDNQDNDCNGEIDEGDVCPCDLGEERFEECGSFGIVDVCVGVQDDSYINCCGKGYETPDTDTRVYVCIRGQGWPFKLDGLDSDGDGYYQDDCNDDDPEIFPGATEVCNGKDDDCNYIIDDSCIY